MRFGISTAAALAALVVSLAPTQASADGRTNAFAQAHPAIDAWQYRTLTHFWLIGAIGNTTIQNHTVGLSSSLTERRRARRSCSA